MNGIGTGKVSRVSGLLCVAVLICLAFVGRAVADESAEEMRARVTELRNDLGRPIEDFNKLYEKELGALKERAKGSGEIDLAIAVSTELGAFRSGESKPSAEPELKRLQEIYAQNIQRLRRERAEREVKLLKHYLLQLSEVMEKLTKAGATEELQVFRNEVSIVNEEIESIESGAAPRKLAGAPGAVAPFDPPDPPELDRADAERIERARQLHELKVKSLGENHPQTIEAMKLVLHLLLNHGYNEAAIPYLIKIVELDRGDGPVMREVAAVLIWFGKHKEHEDFIRGQHEWMISGVYATQLQHAQALNCLTQITNMRQFEDPELPELALKNIKTAIDILNGPAGDKDNPFLATWFDTNLGIAEYRIGKYKEAEERLAAIVEGNEVRMAGDAARIFRAMCLLRLGNRSEAKALLDAAARDVNLPPVESDPLKDNPNQYRLFIWLSYKEAMAMMGR